MVKASVISRLDSADVSYSTGKAVVPTSGSIEVGELAPGGTVKSTALLVCEGTLTLTATSGDDLTFTDLALFSSTLIAPMTLANDTQADIEVEWIIIHQAI